MTAPITRGLECGKVSGRILIQLFQNTDAIVISVRSRNIYKNRKMPKLVLWALNYTWGKEINSRKYPDNIVSVPGPLFFGYPVSYSFIPMKICIERGMKGF